MSDKKVCCQCGRITPRTKPREEGGCSSRAILLQFLLQKSGPITAEDLGRMPVDGPAQ
jgi:hypothetical protein